MRAKFKIKTVTRTEYGQEILNFDDECGKSYPADGSDEDNSYAKFTPVASLEMHVTNPELLGKFEPGDVFYVDFTKAEKVAE